MVLMGQKEGRGMEGKEEACQMGSLHCENMTLEQEGDERHANLEVIR